MAKAGCNTLLVGMPHNQSLDGSVLLEPEVPRPAAK